MENLYGGIAGLVTGVVGSFLAALVGITAKRLRNAVLLRRGEPGYKDVVFRPLWVLMGLAGFIAGVCWTFQLDGTWVTGAIAGLGLPAAATLGYLFGTLLQLRR